MTMNAPARARLLGRRTPSIPGIAAILAAAVIAAGCQAYRVGDPARTSIVGTEVRATGIFRSISVADSIRVHVRIGAPASVAVTADEDALPHVATSVRGDVLAIWLDGSIPAVDARVDVVVPAIAIVEAGSSASVAIDDLEADAFAVFATSSADVSASGTVAHLVARASDSSALNLADLHVRTAQVDLASASNARILASDTIVGAVRESSDLALLGSPARVDVRATSAARVQRI
jgi:hypothetical protein